MKKILEYINNIFKKIKIDGERKDRIIGYGLMNIEHNHGYDNYVILCDKLSGCLEIYLPQHVIKFLGIKRFEDTDLINKLNTGFNTYCDYNIDVLCTLKEEKRCIFYDIIVGLKEIVFDYSLNIIDGEIILPSNKYNYLYCKEDKEFFKENDIIENGLQKKYDRYKKYLEYINNIELYPKDNYDIIIKLIGNYEKIFAEKCFHDYYIALTKNESNKILEIIREIIKNTVNESENNNNDRSGNEDEKSVTEKVEYKFYKNATNFDKFLANLLSISPDDYYKGKDNYNHYILEYINKIYCDIYKNINSFRNREYKSEYKSNKYSKQSVWTNSDILKISLKKHIRNIMNEVINNTNKISKKDLCRDCQNLSKIVFDWFDKDEIFMKDVFDFLIKYYDKNYTTNFARDYKYFDALIKLSEDREDEEEVIRVLINIF